MMITSAPDIDLDPRQLQRSPELALLDALFTVAQQAHEQPLELGEVVVHNPWSWQLQGPQGAVPLFANWNITRVLRIIIHSHSSFIFHHLLIIIIIHHHHHPRHCPLCLMF